MIFAGFLIAFLAVLIQAQTPQEEIPVAVSTQEGEKVIQEAVVLPLTILGPLEVRGRGDIEIEDQPKQNEFQGYFYPKPSKPFNLPAFKTLDAEETEIHSRTRRSPYRRPHYPSPPPFRPGFIPPHHIRPLPVPYPHPYPYPHGRPHHV